VKVAKKQKVSLGEILRAALEALPEKKASDKKNFDKKGAAKKSKK
jgi:hypothetical protein